MEILALVGVSHTGLRAKVQKLPSFARNKERASHVVEELTDKGSVAVFFKADVSREEAVKDMINAVIEHFGRLDVVVNNAGCGSQHCGINPGDPPGMRWEIFRSANLDSNYFVSAHALPHLAKNQGSTIINISSTSALHGNWGLYGAAKIGVEGMTRSFAAGSGILRNTGERYQPRLDRNKPRGNSGGTRRRRWMGYAASSA